MANGANIASGAALGAAGGSAGGPLGSLFGGIAGAISGLFSGAEGISTNKAKAIGRSAGQELTPLIEEKFIALDRYYNQAFMQQKRELDDTKSYGLIGFGIVGVVLAAYVIKKKRR